MRLLLVLAALVAFAGFARAEGTRFHNPTAQFELTKPEGWGYLTADQNAANLAAVETGDPEFRKAIARYATAPMVALAKHPEPFDDLNPSLKVNVRPLGDFAGQQPTAILTALMPALRSVAADATLAQPPTPVKVGGLDGAYMRFNYTLRAGGAEYPTTSELWVVPRGEFFFLIGAGTRQDETTGSRAEIAQIIESIRFGP